MKKILPIILLAIISLSGNLSNSNDNINATCTGSAHCHACRNCNHCKYCHKNGGTCGVCSKKSN